MKKILVVSCTQRSRQEQKQLKIYESAKLLKGEVKLKIHYNNTRSLSSVYNEYINSRTLRDHDIALFVHDDVYIDDLKLRGKLYSAASMFDIIGLAGCDKPVVKKPVLWHLMSDRSNWRGFVAHPVQSNDDMLSVTSFGPTPSRVCIIDGLFMAVNLRSVIDADWKFNENFSFHHYDISSCLDANKKRLKIGVTPIHVIHDSPGLLSTEDPLWRASEEKFLELYQ